MYCFPPSPDAVATIHGGREVPGLTGRVCFYQKQNSVLVVAQIEGLPSASKTGFFAFHVHEGNSCGGAEFARTGGHYNPHRTEHPSHAGDLPPLLLCGDGAYLAVQTDRFRVRDIIGHTVVIHSDADDFRTQPAGNAGKKIGCGVIRAGRAICSCRQKPMP